VLSWQKMQRKQRFVKEQLCVKGRVLLKLFIKMNFEKFTCDL